MGYRVEVQVADRPPRGGTHVDAEVVAARVELALDPLAHGVGEPPHRALLFGGEREVVGLGEEVAPGEVCEQAGGPTGRGTGRGWFFTRGARRGRRTMK